MRIINVWCEVLKLLRSKIRMKDFSINFVFLELVNKMPQFIDLHKRTATIAYNANFAVNEQM